MKKDSTKPKKAKPYRIPTQLWKFLKKHLPKPPTIKKPGRPRVNNRNVIDGIWHVLWTGCQWKAIERDWFGVSSSVLHERFQSWQQQGIWEQVFRSLLRFYGRRRRIQWKWQSIDSRSCASPLGGSDTGDNPTDRATKGSKIHILVDQHGAPLSVWITGANQHDKWSLEDLVIHMLVKRPTSDQHLCADKGYDYPDVHQFVTEQGYQKHIK